MKTCRTRQHWPCSRHLCQPGLNATWLWTACIHRFAGSVHVLQSGGLGRKRNRLRSCIHGPALIALALMLNMLALCTALCVKWLCLQIASLFCGRPCKESSTIWGVQVLYIRLLMFGNSPGSFLGLSVRAWKFDFAAHRGGRAVFAYISPAIERYCSRKPKCFVLQVFS